MKKQTLLTISAIAQMLVLTITPFSTHAASMGAFNSGDLIKGSGSTVYYFASNGKRFVFPNEKTYFTWYRNFDGVRTISDGQLAAVPLGGNVTYRPGYKMVKVTTDPRVYVVDQGGVLRHVATEQLAITLYPVNWNDQIDDVPDAFFTNYRIGTPIQMASDYNPANVMTQTVRINQDKQFDETKINVTVSTMNNGFVPNTTSFKRGTEVTWTNRDIVAHSIIGSGWSSPLLNPGQTFVHRFDTVGSYDYHCGIHPVMQGTINVVN